MKVNNLVKRALVYRLLFLRLHNILVSKLFASVIHVYVMAVKLGVNRLPPTNVPWKIKSNAPNVTLMVTIRVKYLVGGSKPR